MKANRKYQLYTFDEFCQIVPEGQKADLIDGYIYMASPDNMEHYELYDWLSQIVGLFMEESGQGGKKVGSRVALRLDQRNGPEPDLAYIRKDRLKIIQKTFVDGPPDWAMEIVSPDSVDRDYVKKRYQYEEFGIKEYWIIDPMVEKVTCLRLGRDGKYKKVKVTRGILKSKALPGFWLKIEWLWQQPLPKLLPTLQTILGGID